MSTYDGMTEYQACRLCPRSCGVNRSLGQTGRCHMTDQLFLARAALHMWEEPCISGTKGSGTIFFSGCNLGCVFCQNYHISGGESGKKVTAERLTEIFFELEEKGANNINLVTPDHYIPSVRKAIEAARAQGFRLPFLYNTSSYVTVDSLKMLEGLIDIYLPDFKYWSAKRAGKYSGAPDYPEVARKAIAEMSRQLSAGKSESLCSFDDRGILQKGMVVRHLLMPGAVLEAKLIVKYLYETYGDTIYISLMNQYTPTKNQREYPELNRRVTEREYDSLIDYAVCLGVKNGYMQEKEAASESFIPPFDYEGV